MIRIMIMLVFLLLASSITIYLPILFDDINAQTDVNPSCVLRGESPPTPLFVVLRWNSSGFCDSTIDHFTHFYDIRAVLNNNTEYIVFLESK